jgi:hypothetical protein
MILLTDIVTCEANVVSVNKTHENLLVVSVGDMNQHILFCDIYPCMSCIYSDTKCDNLEQCCALGLYVPVILRH